MRLKTQTSAGKILATVFWYEQGILFIDYYEKEGTINRTLRSIIGAFEGRNRLKTAAKKEKIDLSPSRSQRWQNYMNCTSYGFCNHLILQIWSQVTTGCLQTSKEYSRERDLAPMKKWYRKMRRNLRPKTNRSTKKAWNC